MTVQQQVPVDRSTANGVTTIFPFNYLLLDANDLEVYLGNNLADSSLYTINGLNNSSGGEVVFYTAPASGTIVTRKRSVALERLVDYQNAGDFRALTVNYDFNRLWQALQDVGYAGTRSLHVGPSDDTDFDNLQIPGKEERANYFLVFDADGKPSLSSGTGADAGLRADLANPLLGPPLIGVKRVLTGAITTTLQSWLDGQAINVMTDFGADPTGASDSTAAIQAAATAAGYGGTLIFPIGTYFVSSTITLRGATKMLGWGVEATIIKRTGDYGNTFVCGTSADQSEPARSFEARKIRFQHSDPYTPGASTIPNKATTGAHLAINGAQECTIEDCWFWRLPTQLNFQGGSWVKLINNQFTGVYDSQTPALQEGFAHVVSQYSAVHGNPTTWTVKGNNFLGATRVRNITYVSTSGDVVVNRTDTVGPEYGLYIDGLEDLDLSGNYFGGQSVAEIGVFNAAGGGVIDLRVTRNFFDGIARGQGILFAPTIANLFSLGVSIKGNIFVDNKNAIFVNRNIGSNSPSVYNLSIRGNICFSGIGTQILLNGAKGFSCSGNGISDYNKYNISNTDAAYTGGILAYGVSAKGLIEGNVLGGGGNTLLNTVDTNYCYAGVAIADGLDGVFGRNNLYNGIRSGSNFQTGLVVDSNQKTLTTGSYQMSSSDSILLINKIADEVTAAALPLYPCEGREILVKDAKGNAASFNTTITTNDGTTIDGAASHIISANFGFVRLRFNGVAWNRIG